MVAKGRIFAVEEFSTYDGPGIRMTVFLKGCPLRCQWCHNPEGQSFEKQMAKSPNGCSGCGRCVEEGRTLTGSPCLVPSSANVCPHRLVRECGEDVTAEEICERIMKNAQILAMSGGGVTFSGGEPLCQSNFLLSCLELLEGKIHRAVQTCGYCSSELFRQTLDKCDYALYDLKLIDGEAHKLYTGVSNELILSNYRLLALSGKDFITRIPLIPTVNDTPKNIRATAELMSSLGVREVELLPYNRMAGAKYALVGRQYEISFDHTKEVCVHENIFAEYGVKVRIL